MATDNYFVVRREGSKFPRVEFFFDSTVPTSVENARRVAQAYADQLTEMAQLLSDEHAAATKSNPQIVPTTPVQVFAHGVRGLGDLHCLGGCSICIPHDSPVAVDDEDEDVVPSSS